MLDVSVYTLEDDKDYSLVDSLVYKGNVYVLLAEIDNIDNICIRKITKKNNEEFFERLDVDFDIIFKKFLEKNIKLIDKE